MSATPVGATFEHLAAALERDGWAVCDAFLAARDWAALALACRAHLEAGDLRPAAVGRSAARRIEPGVRDDWTHWLDAAHAGCAELAFLARLDELRAALNQRLFLGLASAEAHYACYAPGARYRVHRDRFRDDDARMVSLVCYLNQAWSAADGGALRLYLDADRARSTDILPVGGRLVAFLSADFEHEVLPASRERLSVAAWLRTEA